MRRIITPEERIFAEFPLPKEANGPLCFKALVARMEDPKKDWPLTPSEQEWVDDTYMALREKFLASRERVLQ